MVALAQVQGLVWLLSFGDYVLLKPELLNWYASAIVRMARKQQEGSVLECDVLEARLDFEDMERLGDPALERSLLHAVVELLLRKEIALREGGRLVFPSKFSLPRPPQPELPPSDIVYSFAGPLEDIYATLIVRLSNSGPFALRQLWKYSAEFRDSDGYACGFYLDGVERGSGDLSVYYARSIPVESKLRFLKFIHEHLLARAVPGSLRRRSLCRCPDCHEPLENPRAIDAALRLGRTAIPCQFCGGPVPVGDMLDNQFGDPELLTSMRRMEDAANLQRGQAVARVIYDAKRNIGEFDVFLAYSSQDVSLLREIALTLKQRGLNPWFDEWNVPPGSSFQDKIEEALGGVKSVAIFVGPSGLGPWERPEMRAAINQFVKRKMPVIPVILPGAEAEPKLPLFLQEFSQVRFESFPDEKATTRFIWGIASAPAVPV